MRLVIPVGLLLAFGAASPVFAALGGDYSSVEADSASIKAQLRTTATTQYSVHELTTSTGTTVREYVSDTGKVFALTWHGFVMPDLSQLLGTYFNQYTQAAQAASHPGGHRSLQISQPGLVAQSFGRMRDFHGKAYAPDLVPSGVVVADLQ